MTKFIETEWQRRRTRFENGIYFASDEFIALVGSPDVGYRAEPCRPIAVLLASNPDGWSELDELCTAESEEFALVAGETPWEGSGFIALTRISSSALVWILQLSNSERFVNLILQGSTIHAVSREYPFLNEWIIPIEQPEQLQVRQLPDE